MERDFRYFRDKYGDAGARDKFENVCTELLQEMYGDAYQIKPFPGDEGIDIYVGNFDNPINVYQCKYFLDGLGNSQKDQIRKSYKKCIETDKYELEKWFLCLPIILTIDETKWWTNWKKKMEKENGKDIKLIDGSRLLGLLKKNNLFRRVFDINDYEKIEMIYKELVEKKKYLQEVIYELDIDEIDYSEDIFIAKLESAQIFEHEMCQNEFYNAEIVQNTIKSKEVEEELIALENLKKKLHNTWFPEYLTYDDKEKGMNLLSSVYKRVEDLNSSVLKHDDISIVAKKGFLHQLADECKVGWVKDYKNKLEEYLKIKENKND